MTEPKMNIDDAFGIDEQTKATAGLRDPDFPQAERERRRRRNRQARAARRRNRGAVRR